MSWYVVCSTAAGTLRVFSDVLWSGGGVGLAQQCMFLRLRLLSATRWLSELHTGAALFLFGFGSDFQFFARFSPCKFLFIFHAKFLLGNCTPRFDTRLHSQALLYSLTDRIDAADSHTLWRCNVAHLYVWCVLLPLTALVPFSAATTDVKEERCFIGSVINVAVGTTFDRLIRVKIGSRRLNSIITFQWVNQSWFPFYVWWLLLSNRCFN